MKHNEEGFTLIELLLVVVIIGLMLAVIVPRAWRANVDAKYGLVRQNCSELASFAQEWAENQLLAQDAQTSTATADDYLSTLTLTAAGPWASGNMDWVAQGGNWAGRNAAGTITVVGRALPNAAAPQAPETTVEGILPPEKVIRNPFNEASVFNQPNDPSDAGIGTPVTGAIACGTFTETSGVATDVWHYYAFLFQGTDSTTVPVTGTTAATDFYAGQDMSNLAGLRNGIFLARVR